MSKPPRGDRKSVSRKQKQRRPLGDNHPLVKKLKAAIISCDGKQTEVAKIFKLSTPEISKLIQANHLRDFAAAVRKAKRKKQKIATLEPASILMEMRRADEAKAVQSVIQPQYLMMLPGMYSSQQIQSVVLQQMQGNLALYQGTQAKAQPNGTQTVTTPTTLQQNKKQLQMPHQQPTQTAAAAASLSSGQQQSKLITQQILTALRKTPNGGRLATRDFPESVTARKRKTISPIQEGNEQNSAVYQKRKLSAIPREDIAASLAKAQILIAQAQTLVDQRSGDVTATAKKLADTINMAKAVQNAVAEATKMNELITNTSRNKNSVSSRHEDVKAPLAQIQTESSQSSSEGSSGMNTESVDCQLSPQQTTSNRKNPSKANGDGTQTNSHRHIQNDVRASHHDHMLYSSSDTSHDGAMCSTSTEMGNAYSIMI